MHYCAELESEYAQMFKSRLATGDDIASLTITINTAAVAVIASMIQQQKPEQRFAECVVQAIERVQAVDVPNLQL